MPTLTHALEHPPEALVGFGIGGIEAGRAPHGDVIRDVFAGRGRGRAALRPARRAR